MKGTDYESFYSESNYVPLLRTYIRDAIMTVLVEKGTLCNKERACSGKSDRRADGLMLDLARAASS